MLGFDAGPQTSQHGDILGPSHKLYMKQKTDLLLQCIRENGLDTKLTLDVGCGAGELEKNLTHQFDIVGIDLAVSMLRVAKDRRRDCEFLRANCTKLPFRDDAFTMVLVVNVLHHLKLGDRQPFFTEISKMLAPNGHMVVFEHNPRNPFTRIVVRSCQIDRDAVLLNTEEVASLAYANQIDKVDIEYLTFFPPVLSFMTPHEKRMQHLPLGGEFMFLGRKKL